MKILVVDDSADKIREISRCLCESGFVATSDIETVGDSLSAKRKLSENFYDLLIIDINLPPDAGSYPERDEGANFLNHISMSPNVRVPMHIVGITQYEDIFFSSSEAFERKMWNIIYYKPDSVAWKEKIKEKIAYLHKLMRQNAAIERTDVVLMTTVDVEQRSVFKLPIEWVRFSVPNDPCIYYRGELVSDNDASKTWTIVTASCLRMGMAASSALASKMIYHFRPKYMVMVGICAGIPEKTRYGDIIIGDPVWSYESGKYTCSTEGDKFLPDPHHVNLDIEIRSKVKDLISRRMFLDQIASGWEISLPKNSNISAHIGPIGSGSAVIANQKLVAPIVGQQRKVLGIEMEGYGFMVSAETVHISKPKSIVIKSVSDFADSEKSDKWQEFAAYTSANYFFHLIKWFLDARDV